MAFKLFDYSLIRSTKSKYCISVSNSVTIEKSYALDCVLDGDGIYEKGCVSFIKCVNGTAYNIECHNGQVFNSITQDCDDPKVVPKPCGNIMDCTLKDDGHYPDLDMGCHSYYTCNSGTFLGHNYCPAGLIFSPENGVCDWQHNVYFPCGLKPHPPTTAKQDSATDVV
ncbi:hypothetical protein LOTGIDRAFT_239077 [Lottia gigantea]|uniref:Chitin-binding type-2 domain-containing protein n=1 Tax=Lottia gigantea TaxID=225164 RepID=V4ATF1_LOTGI|nr:hypothetical protein LOTGIDRAFT_239077 [Lottia gigantea]ESO98175.1 hypothetical protein LOTGIDRAFT_239077 [Lottia gigantea]